VPDGALDGTLTATVTGPARTVKQLVLVATGVSGGRWDTLPANSYWVLAAAGLDTPVLNAANGAVNFPVASVSRCSRRTGTTASSWRGRP
jgi:hypothetical protein